MVYSKLDQLRILSGFDFSGKMISLKKHRSGYAPDTHLNIEKQTNVLIDDATK